MKVNIAPDISSILADYFQNNPYSFNSPVQAFVINFYKDSELIATLPENNWIEFGFFTSQTENNKNRLFSVCRTTFRILLLIKAQEQAMMLIIISKLIPISILG